MNGRRIHDKITILHVDDDKEFLELVEKKIDCIKDEEDNIEILKTDSPEDALRIAEEENIDCVLSDYQMDDTDGLELLKDLRTKHPDLPFILLTGKGSEEIASDAISHGATDYFRKKSSISMYRLLVNRIENAVESYRAVEKERRTLERINDAFFGLDSEWRITYLNENAHKLLENSEDPVGDYFWNTIENDCLELKEEFEKAMEQQKPVSFETRHEITGEWYSVKIYPSKNGISAYLRDITDRRSKQEELSKRVKQQDIVAELGHQAIKENDIENIVKNAAEKVLSGLNADYCRIFEIKPEYDMNSVSKSIDKAEVAEDSVAEYSFTSENSVRVSNLDEDERLDENTALEPCPDSCISASIKLNDEALGVLTTYHTDGQQFTDQDRDFVESITNILASTIERHRNEKELEKYRKIAETTDDIFYLSDREGNIKWVNSAAEEILEMKKEELIGTNAEELMDSEDLEHLKEKGSKIAETGESETVNTRLDVPGSKENRQVEISFKPYRFKNGKKGRVGMVRDITDRVKRSDQLERFETMIKTMEDAIYLIDSDNEIKWINDSGSEMLGYEKENLIGEKVSKISKEDNIEEMDRLQKNLEEDGETGIHEEKLIHKNEREIPVEIRFTPYRFSSGETGRLGIAREISNKKKRERQLRQFEKILKTVDVGVYVTNEEYEFEFVNQAYADLSGRQKEDLIGSYTGDLLTEEENEEMSNKIENMMKNGETTSSHKGHYLSPEGDKVPVETRFKLRKPGKEGFQGTMGIVRDRSEQKRTREHLKTEKKQSRKKYEKLVEASPDGIIIMDNGFIVERANKAVEKQLGLDRESIEGEKIDILEEKGIISEEDYGKYKQEVRELTESDERDSISFKIKVNTTEGEEKHFRVKILKFYDSTGDIFKLGCLTHDITEIERQRKIQDAKLKEFSSLISHDLRNPLNVAQGYLELLRESDDEEDIEVIEKAHERMEEIIEELMLITAEKESIEKEEFSLREVSEEAYYFSGNEESEFSIEEDKKLHGDKSGTVSMFENLISNSLEHNEDPINIRIGSLENGFYYEDDGRGIEKDRRDKVFEYGHSTSENGRGLGLSIVRRIADVNDWNLSLTESDTGGFRLEVRS